MEEEFISKLSSKMLKAVDLLKQDLASVRTGRAAPQLIENVTLPVYKGSQNLKLVELANITALDARTLTISPYDPSIVEEIAKGLQQANLGFNPIAEGKVIRIIIPPLTEERRREFLKLSKLKAEGGRIMIRQVRHEAMIDLKRKLEEGQIDQDSKKRLEKQIQQVTDEAIAQINSLLAQKEKELMQL